MDKDLTAKECFSVDERYADLINGLLFNGEQRVQPADLQELDSQLWSKQRRKKKNKYRPMYRDLIRKSAFGVNFALLGIENQLLVHYLMPLRTMEYDAAEYRRQAVKIAKLVESMNGLSDAEFISKFRKNDKLRLCITIVLYYGEDWDGAKTLHELLDFTDIPADLRKYVNDYPIHIFNVLEIKNTEVFKTDIKQIFDFLQCAKDKERLKELIEKDSAYQQMEEEAYDMIAAFTNEEMYISIKDRCKKEGKVDMCQALRELMEDSKLVGMEEGIEKGMEKGIEKGIEVFVRDKVEDGVEESRIVGKLVFFFDLSMDKAREYVEKYR